MSKKASTIRRGGSATVNEMLNGLMISGYRNFIVTLSIFSAAIMMVDIFNKKQNSNVVIQADIEKEAEEVKRRYHERVLEKLKSDTIAAEV